MLTFLTDRQWRIGLVGHRLTEPASPCFGLHHDHLAAPKACVVVEEATRGAPNEQQEDRHDDAVDGVVQDDGVHVGRGLGAGEELARVDGVGVGVALGEEADLGVVGEDLLPAGGEGDGDVEGQRNAGHPGPAQLAGLDEHGGGDGQGDRGEQLVGDAEQREELLDPAERVGDVGVEEVSPGTDDQGAGEPDSRIPGDAADGLPEVPEHVLEHEAADAGAGVHVGEDEQGLDDGRCFMTARSRSRGGGRNVSTRQPARRTAAAGKNWRLPIT
ncbi:hypothetical protein KPATCC21470_7975 [Kitasatospora purpeofusca]